MSAQRVAWLLVPAEWRTVSTGSRCVPDSGCQTETCRNRDLITMLSPSSINHHMHTYPSPMHPMSYTIHIRRHHPNILRLSSPHTPCLTLPSSTHLIFTLSTPLPAPSPLHSPPSFRPLHHLPPFPLFPPTKLLHCTPFTILSSPPHSLPSPPPSYNTFPPLPSSHPPLPLRSPLIDPTRSSLPSPLYTPLPPLHSSLEQGIAQLLVHDHGLKHGTLSNHKLNHPVDELQ